MPPSSPYAIQEVLMRHGIDIERAKIVSRNELRHWELADIENICVKVKREPKTFCPFSDPDRFLRAWRQPQETHDKIRSILPSLFESDSPWLSPPRSLVLQAAQEKAALCINAGMEWSIRRSDYVALSHVWSEGLQQDKQRKAVQGNKIDLVFKTLIKANIRTEWIWTDVLSIPGGGGPTDNLDDDLLKMNIINSMPEIYANAEAVVIFDALVWQLQTRDALELAAVLVCGLWASRVWTFQEIKMARKAYIIYGWYHAIPWADVTQMLKAAAEKDPRRYYQLWTAFAIMSWDDKVNICVRDIAYACQTRRSGIDVDYARAFFPTFGLEWQNGMTREQGMQKIYRSQMEDTTRIIFSFGHPRLKIRPAWAPSYMNGLEMVITSPMLVEERGVRGDLFVAQIVNVERRMRRFGRTALTLNLGDGQIQCVLAPDESEETIRNFDNAISQGTAYMITHEPADAKVFTETAVPVILVAKADTADYDGFEAAVHCSALRLGGTRFSQTKESVLLRHESPLPDDLENKLLYMFYSQREESIPTHLKQQEGESALHAAVRNNDVAMAENLLSKGCSIEDFDSRGWTPLHTAAARGNLEVLRCLVAQAGNIDIAGKQMNKDTPLGLAAEHDKAGAIEILAAAGATIEARNSSNYTPLMVAASEGSYNALRTLIELRAEINCHNSLESALLVLCSRPHKQEARLEVLKLMLDAGASPDGIENRMGWTPLHRAVEWSDEATISTLVARGANVNAKMNGSLHTPLYIAINKNRPGVVRLLLDAGADRNAVFEGNWTPTHMAAKCPDYEIMGMLLEQEVELDSQLYDRGWTPLHVATSCRHMQTVKMLLEAGADVNIMAADGLTPLRLAEQIEASDLVDTFRHFASTKRS
ncbi:hypothetical protein JMJ35_002681 [Cladonia borealis]|uniref:Ankyrin repeat protein n=1 Tax=Cladonia borealis TaxID=184061 RepID=A0AA39R5I6_9LECA|nr:hypothetical protein JMJ35_002681 [Cladonia borealis]